MNFKDDLVECHSLCWTIIIKKVWWKVKETDFKIHSNFLNHGNNKIILLLQKDVFPNEYIDDWKKIQ